jgi:hypothetical protein
MISLYLTFACFQAFFEPMTSLHDLDDDLQALSASLDRRVVRARS